MSSNSSDQGNQPQIEAEAPVEPQSPVASRNIPVGKPDPVEFELTTDDGRPAHKLDELFEILQTTTRLELFKTTLRFEESNFIKLCEAIKLNKSIKVMRILVSNSTNAEKYLPILVNALNKNMKRFEICLDDPETEFSMADLLKHLKGLRSPTKSFKLIMHDYNMEGEYYDEYYQKHIELLQTTNIDKIEWSSISLFGASTANKTGFEQFSEYLVESNNIKSFSCDLELHTEILTKFTSLTHLAFTVVSYEQALQMSKLIQLSESVIKCNVCLFDYPNDEGTYEGDKQEYRRIVQEAVRRNRKLQNSRVNALITVLFNIARDTSSTVPRDIWTLIMSLVTIPGVSLDFGVISQSIFKANSIRRVIQKRVKKMK